MILTATMRNIRQNLIFAFVYNMVRIPVAAGVLHPAFGVLLSPVIAAAAMALSSLSVVTNANRLRGYKARKLPAPAAVPQMTPTIEVSPDQTGEESRMARVKDPVCGMEIDPKNAVATEQ